VLTGTDKLAIMVYGIAADLDLNLRVGRDIDRGLRQLETGPDTDPGEIILAWLRTGGSTPPHPGNP
jgi:hypothetical protein